MTTSLLYDKNALKNEKKKKKKYTKFLKIHISYSTKMFKRKIDIAS